LALTEHVLWFEQANKTQFGVAGLHEWLIGQDTHEFKSEAECRLVHETAATATLDAQRGLSPMMQARAAEIALEKAREVGVGLVSVWNFRPKGSAAPLVASVALGPFLASSFGPEAQPAIAIPVAGGLPRVIDLAWADSRARHWAVLNRILLGRAMADSLMAFGWVVQVTSVQALGNEGTPFENETDLADESVSAVAAECVLEPETWHASRERAWKTGVAIPQATWKSLKHWIERAKMEPPQPLGRTTRLPNSKRA
jgi:LDH2 family malate/lactate/ureidoglycolate dehydrogenase